MGFAKTPGIEIAGLCGRTESERNLNTARQFKTRFYTSLDEALEKEKPDIVSVASLEADHCKSAVKALNAGAHVYCEKVLAASEAEAQEMVRCAKKNNKKLMTGYNYRFSPSAVKVKEIIQSGRLGKMLTGSVFTFGYCLHHVTDLILSFLGETDEVYALIDHEEKGGKKLSLVGFPDFIYSASSLKAYVLKFKNGAVVNFISTDYHTSFFHPAVNLVLGGTQGWVKMDDISGVVSLHLNSSRAAEVFLPSQIVDSIDLPSLTQIAVKEFCLAVQSDQEVPVSGEDGLRLIRLEKAIYQSAQIHEPVKIN